MIGQTVVVAGACATVRTRFSLYVINIHVLGIVVQQPETWDLQEATHQWDGGGTRQSSDVLQLFLHQLLHSHLLSWKYLGLKLLARFLLSRAL